MALLVEGKTTCFICNRQIDQMGEAVLFPPFFANKYDPLIQFNDAAVHSGCLNDHPEASKLYGLLDAYGKRKRLECSICHKMIDKPEEYVGIGCLSSSDAILSGYNFTQYHKSCFEGSDNQSKIDQQVKVLREKGEWRSDEFNPD